MKKLKFTFTYECEIEIKEEEELKMFTENLRDEDNINGLANEINEMLLIDDGRKESGAIEEYSFEVEE